MAEYIKFMYKTARKFWASVGVVTQEIQDIIGSEIVKEAIINNSDVVMLLDQSKFKERFDTIKAVLRLTMLTARRYSRSTVWTTRTAVRSSGRRSIHTRGTTASGVYGVEEPHECYMTYTTERARRKLKLYKEELRCSHQGSHRRPIAGVGCQRHRPVPDIRRRSEAGQVLNLKAKQ